jgi:polysaccharide export outer membrane protein
MSQQIQSKSRINLGNAPTYAAVLFLLMQGSVFGGDGEDLAAYRLGPEDQISIRVNDLDKLQLDNASAPKINVNGDLDLPVIGHLHAEGLTLEQLKAAIVARLGDVLNDPSVSVSIMQYRSHPVSVLGAVRNPGVFQVAQSKHLLEVLSLAGGLAPEAGDSIKISRLKWAAPLPLHDVIEDAQTGYLVGTIQVRALMQATDTGLNIQIFDGDVIAVAKAELIYIMGAVKRSGGFTLGDRSAISVLQALSLAEGLDRAASLRSCRLLREEKPGEPRTEIQIDLKPIMAGKAQDIPLRANDILFIPTSGAKLASMRGLEAAVQLGTGFAIFK